MGPWEWTPPGVLIGGTLYRVGENLTLRELEELRPMLKIAAELFMTLDTAHLAFGQGNALYVNCYANLHDLVNGLEQAKAELVRRISEVETFFDPGGASAALPLKERLGWAIQAVDELGRRIKKKDEEALASQGVATAEAAPSPESRTTPGGV